ncbi:MAG: hypothetical protein E7215_00090 [Clostridium sulfidigenes]|uniref:CD-NTase associated protein 4-like DNA endonuclease domain-containing protein n=1 Tax=Clostridium sulfidigenes TaxID=318464 RepID=A0A927W3Y6_9CLOT|nr:hypothetical protein [Clostridium sulfidigenes]
MVDKSTNAGVHASTGFELQKHCALFIILERFNELKDKDYFVCIEHSDDIIFGFFDLRHLQKIEAYQVKKSSTIWSINEKWREIIKGILDTGKFLSEDTFPKTDDYSHKISFLSNQTSTLKVKIKGVDNGKENKKDSTIISNIDEANSSVTFYSLPIEIRDKIKKDLALEDNSLISELNNLFFEYIDLNRKVKEQKNCLRGKCTEVFGNRIADPEAAIDTIMKVFRKVEHEFNQGNITRMLDESKRVYSTEIKSAFDIITTKSMAFKLWREQKKELGKGLAIPLSQRENFETQFDNSIDFFKDLSQVEHNKILKFVEENRNMFDQFYDESECIIELYNTYKNKYNCKLDDLVIKATIFAAYIKIGEIV